MFNDCIIMAGGSGTRLWPASNSRTPKQFLSVSADGGNSSFFSAAVDRALGVIDIKGDGRVIIIAGKSHVPHIIRACEKYGQRERNHLVLIPEPAARNTAPAIACAVMYADWVSGQDRNILVLTSDHIIQPPELFTANAAAAAAFAQQDKLAVFGISPQGPETGYGYIETGESLTVPPEGEFRRQDGSRAEPEVFRVLSFREKPDKDRAEQFLAAGTFYWNSGMFAFSSRFIIREFRRRAPELIGPFDKLRAPDERSYMVQGGIRILRDWQGLKEAYERVKNISFDYAIAEKCGQTVMVAAAFRWFDVGSWDEYAKLAEHSGGPGSEVYRSGSRNCFVDADIPVALCGVDDLIVVVRSGRNGGPPSVLISKKGETQRVREIVEQIKAAGRTELL
jgi:mannose-1-phosphate guanylyltransferase/mannose-1-phosphate guanylyltransferase/mannose-6-phosphate isomerase